MPPDRLLSELARVARAVGLEVRSVSLRGKQAGPGGVCTIRGKAVVILNERVSLIDRTTALADALVGRDLAMLDMPAEVRGLISARKHTRSRLLLPQRRPGPGLASCHLTTGRDRPREG